jgi:hypothetical protein
VNSRTITTAVTSLSTSFTTHQITKITCVKQHRHTGISNDYNLFVCCLWVSFGHREMIAAGLKITVFCLSYLHPVPRQLEHIKFHQNYSKLRRYIGICVLIDHILTTHMNIHGMEPAYASCKEAHVLIYYIWLFQNRIRVQCWILIILFIICQFIFGRSEKCVWADGPE